MSQVTSTTMAQLRQIYTDAVSALIAARELHRRANRYGNLLEQQDTAQAVSACEAAVKAAHIEVRKQIVREYKPEGSRA